MDGRTVQPKVFISYSWTSPRHEEWVVEFAERLSSDGVVVVLDKWDLKEGQDKHKFMEQMVHDPTISKVLVVCDRGYQAKADDRKGGVGTESQLISKEVYENTAQEKFIPIVREYDPEGKPCIPHFMAARIYIDFSEDEAFEVNYQKLVRNLYDKPLLKRPPLGTPPGYITEEEQVVLKTARKLLSIKDALINERKSAGGLIADFLDTFIASLEEFRLTGGGVVGFDDKVVASIERLLPLRNDFIDFTLILFKYRDSVDLDELRDFFERLVPFIHRPESVSSWTDIDFDNYRFFNYEVMLSFVAILLKLHKYDAAGYFVQSEYFYRSNTGELTHSSMEIFNRYVRSLDEFRNNRLGLRRVSITADMIKARATHSELRFDDMRQADLVLHFIYELRGSLFDWFPRTSIYGGWGSRVELFDRMISERHFQKVKVLFGVNTVEEIKKLIAESIARRGQQRYGAPFEYDIPSLEHALNVEKIGTVR